MSDTRRRHESLSRAKRRGPKNKVEDGDPRPPIKSHKQKRPNERARLRKEYLR